MRKLFALFFVVLFFSGCNLGKLRDMPVDGAQDPLSNVMNLEGDAQAPAAFSNPQDCGDPCNWDYCKLLSIKDCKLRKDLAFVRFLPPLLSFDNKDSGEVKPVNYLDKDSLATAREKDFTSLKRSISATSELTANSNVTSSSTSILCSIFDTVINSVGCDISDKYLQDQELEDLFTVMLNVYKIKAHCEELQTTIIDMQKIYENCKRGRIRDFEIKCVEVDPVDETEETGETGETGEVVITDDCRVKCVYPRVCSYQQCVCGDTIDSKVCQSNYAYFSKAISYVDCNKADYYMGLLRDECCVQVRDAERDYKGVCDLNVVGGEVPPIKEIYKEEILPLHLDPIEYQ